VRVGDLNRRKALAEEAKPAVGEVPRHVHEHVEAVILEERAELRLAEMPHFCVVLSE
jgi:hypothetical protein